MLKLDQIGKNTVDAGTKAIQTLSTTTVTTVKETTTALPAAVKETVQEVKEKSSGFLDGLSKNKSLLKAIATVSAAGILYLAVSKE